MAQLKDLLVAGKARFVGTTSFTDQMISLGGIRFLEGALEKKTVVYQVLGIDSSGVAVYADLTGLTIGTANKLSASGGGTMQPVYFASGQPVTLPAFKNLTAAGPLGWVSQSNDIMAVTSNTLAYWNGAYNGTASNITVLGKIQTGTWQATPIDAARGGTGQTSLKNSAKVLVNALDIQTTTPVDADYFISQSVNGGTTTTDYYRRPMSALWNYIKGKSDSVYVNSAGDTMTGSLNINGNNGTTGLIVRRSSADTESLKITVDDSNATFYYTNDERANQFQFVLYNSDTESPASTGAVPNTSTITMAGSASGSVVTATQFVGALSGNATTATTASKLGVNAGSDGKPIYFAGGIPVAFANSIGGAAKPVYVNAGTITACSSTIGSTTKPVYMNAGTITVSNATVGSTSRPMYLNAGTMTAVTAVGTAYGGTGNTTYNANRVVYTESATKMSSTNHFASSVKMAINSTSEPATIFHVEGSANVDGEFSLDSKAKFVYNNTDKCVDIIFV